MASKTPYTRPKKDGPKKFNPMFHYRGQFNVFAKLDKPYAMKVSKSGIVTREDRKPFMYRFDLGYILVIGDDNCTRECLSLNLNELKDNERRTPVFDNVLVCGPVTLSFFGALYHTQPQSWEAKQGGILKVYCHVPNLMWCNAHPAFKDDENPEGSCAESQIYAASWESDDDYCLKGARAPKPLVQ